MCAHMNDWVSCATVSLGAAAAGQASYIALTNGIGVSEQVQQPHLCFAYPTEICNDLGLLPEARVLGARKPV